MLLVGLYHKATRALIKRPWSSAVLIFLAGVLTCALPSIWGGHFPIPVIHDEFSYLLASDTFANGRLANPSHPMWRFFETFHVLTTPTYASKYPPGQGMLLAIGQVVFGRPIVGVWLSQGLMCVAVYWMLRAWLPARFAFLGGFLAAFGYTSAIGWGTSYWGGAVVALGASLVWGGVGRTMRKFVEPRLCSGLAIGSGLLICANSRPLEGAVVAMPALLLLLIITFRDQSRRRELVRRTWIPLTSILALTVVATCIYNYAITGRSLQLPYQLYTRQYDIVPVFYWQDVQLPSFNNARMESFYASLHDDASLWATPLTPDKWFTLQQRKFSAFARYVRVFGYVPIVLAAPLVFSLARRRPARWLVAGILATSAVSLCCVYGITHYYAGISCLVIGVMLSGYRELRIWSRRCTSRGPLRLVVYATIPACFLASAATIASRARSMAAESRLIASGADGLPIAESILAKQGIEDWVTDRGRSDAVVFVRYLSTTVTDEEWVYNHADIDASRVVWARDRGDAENRSLVDYYPERESWLLTIGANNLRQSLSRYGTSTSIAGE